jgi:hypothetical protein
MAQGVGQLSRRKQPGAAQAALNTDRYYAGLASLREMLTNFNVVRLEVLIGWDPDPASDEFCTQVYIVDTDSTDKQTDDVECVVDLLNGVLAELPNSFIMGAISTDADGGDYLCVAEGTTDKQRLQIEQMILAQRRNAWVN